jgi:hypothetical protein
VPTISVTGPTQPSLYQPHSLRLDYPDISLLYNTDPPPLKSHYDLWEEPHRFHAVISLSDEINRAKNPLSVKWDMSIPKNLLGTEIYDRLPRTESGSRCLTVKCGEPLQDTSARSARGGSQKLMKYTGKTKTYVRARPWGSCIGTLPDGSNVPITIGVKWLLPRERVPKHVLDRQCEGQDLVLRSEDFVSLDDTIRADKLTRSGTPSVDDNFLDRLLSERRGYGCLAENVRENRKVQCEQREWADERQIRVNHVYAYVILQLDFPAKVSKPPPDDI